MDGQPGQDDGEGAGRDRDPEPPPPASGSPDPASGAPAPDPAPSGPDPRLARFAYDDSRDGPSPSGPVALVVDELSGPGRRCPGATGDELVGLLRAWAAIESWAAAAKLGVIREVIRREAPPSPGSDHGDLPETWSTSLRYELAGALACSTQSAETTASLAWQLGARLPRVAARLEDGTLTSPKARAITETLAQLADLDAAAAEALIADQLAGKTYTQVLRLAEQAALTVDPHLAERRREHAQKNYARVSLFREQAGTAGLSGRDLPPDEALAAMAAVNARAEQYKESEAFGDTPTDVLRARAYLDLINGLAAPDRIALAEQQDDTADAAQARAAAQPGSEREAESAPEDGHLDSDAPAIPCDCPCSQCDGSCVNHDDRDDEPDGSGQPDDDDPDRGGRAGDDDDSDDGTSPDDSDGSGPGSGGPGGSGSRDDSGGTGCRPGPPSTGKVPERRPADLIVPLATLLGLAERPGDIHGFGLLDPALARDLAAATSPRTEICVTVTSPEGYAIGHGCARPVRGSPQPGPPAPLVTLPARLNLTIPATTLPCLSRLASPTGSWSFTPRTPRGRPGAPDGFGTWTLTLPGGRELTVRLDPVPVFECDHRYETRGYQPSDRLRHLVQIRDGTCTFPPCNRHAHESDFEHALPYDQGGKTCACNAGARSRACHRVKQSPGWHLTQPKPGWHRWQTPAGRVYTQEPKRYPA
jgi:Domain of unknown function (DUF222)